MAARIHAAGAGAAPPRPGWAGKLTAWNTLVLAAWLAVPFLAAGTARWAAGWLHHAALAAGFAASQLWVAHQAPHARALRAARRRPGPGTKGWDLAWNAAFWPLMACPAVVAGLEVRAGGPALSPLAWGPGLLALAAGQALSAWAMACNPFFEGTVRVQRDRDQRVVEVGPYRLVRHPGYQGLAVVAASLPLLLRSAAAAFPAAAVVAWLVLRTALEDRVLARELPGYAAYRRRTRWRLVPGVW